MGTKYTTQATSGYNASPPPDDGTQVAANLITWAGVKTKLADVLKTFGEAINTALVSALDLSARAISTPDTAVASDHWKTLQVTGSTTITLSSAASMGAGYEVGIFNAGTGVVTVALGNAADTINGVSASVTVSIKGTKIFRTNQALTGYNVVGGYDPQTVTATTSVVTPLVQSSGALTVQSLAGAIGLNAAGQVTRPVNDNTDSFGDATHRWASAFTPIIDTGTTGSGALKTNNGTTVLTWANTGAVGWGTGVANFGTITKRKTADESVTSSGVLQNDDHLSFSIAANEEWVVNFYIPSNGVNSGGVQVAITTPAAATQQIEADASGRTATTGGQSTTASGTGLAWASTEFNGVNSFITIAAWILNGANAGTVQLQWAQNVGNGTPTIFRKGSFMNAVRIA